MSQAYIPGIVDNIRSDSTPYIPIIEAVTNAIDAIEKNLNVTDGKIDIFVRRSASLPGLLGTPNEDDIISVEIEDNGVGFNDENRKSFDTIYSQQKSTPAVRDLVGFFILNILLMLKW